MSAHSSLPNPRPAWLVAALLALLMLVNFLDKVVIGLVAVPMSAELGLTATEFGLIGGALHWFFALSAVVGGFMANRRPSRTLLLHGPVLGADPVTDAVRHLTVGHRRLPRTAGYR